MPLRRWREAIHAIPQQSLLLSGSIAHNLDPERHDGAVSGSGDGTSDGGVGGGVGGSLGGGGGGGGSGGGGGGGGASEAEMWEALRMAGLDALVAALPT